MQNSLQDIKQYIYEHNLVDTILYELECENIKSEQNGKLYVAQLPYRFNSDNRRSVQVKNDEKLYSSVRSRGISGDIFNLVGYIQFEFVDSEEVKKNFKNIVNWVKKVIGFDGSEYVSKKKVEYNSWLKEVKRQRNKNIEITRNIPISEDVLNDYRQLPHIAWLKDGLKYDSQIEFEIGLEEFSQHITIPIRNIDGKLIGVKGRYVGNDERILKERKYIYLIPINKSLELYGLHKAMPYIQERKEVVIFEGEKSVILAHQYGQKNSVCISGDTVSPIQIQLLKDLGLDIKWVFAYDTDKDHKWIKNQLKQIKGRDISVVFDKDKKLENKSSPLDFGYEVWYNIYNNRFPFG